LSGWGIGWLYGKPAPAATAGVPARRLQRSYAQKHGCHAAWAYCSATKSVYFNIEKSIVENAMTALTYSHHRKPFSGNKNLLNRVGHRISVYLANYSVAMAWASGRRAIPADLELVGFTRELEDRVIASMRNKPAN
jgi:hypothetical protein